MNTRDDPGIQGNSDRCSHVHDNMALGVHVSVGQDTADITVLQYAAHDMSHGMQTADLSCSSAMTDAESARRGLLKIAKPSSLMLEVCCFRLSKETLDISSMTTFPLIRAWTLNPRAVQSNTVCGSISLLHGLVRPCHIKLRHILVGFLLLHDYRNLDGELCQIRSLPVLCYGCPLQTCAHMSSDLEQGVQEKQHCPVMMQTAAICPQMRTPAVDCNLSYHHEDR